MNGERFFPGSRLPVTPPAGVPEEFRIPTGKKFSVRGVEVELLSISQLAEALNRSPVTIRKWERNGVIPRPSFVKNGKGGDVRGKRRLYSRPQVEAMVRVAASEKILHDMHRHVSATRFSERVFQAFRELQ